MFPARKISRRVFYASKGIGIGIKCVWRGGWLNVCVCGGGAGLMCVCVEGGLV